jgi:tetraacyldisaccharide 4'-kinase
VVVVSDPSQVREPVAVTGDEPQMLARALPGVPVLVSADRFLAGRLAERRFGTTVHLLDDGFQHLSLARDVDLVLVSPDDIDERVLPMGRLREHLEVARGADALLVRGSEDDAKLVGQRLRHDRVFSVSTRFRQVRSVDPYGEPVDLPRQSRVVAVAGIARPHVFVEAVRQQGFEVAAVRTFPDHHWFRRRDMADVAAAVAQAAAVAVVTTEKDAARWPASGAEAPRTVYLPMELVIEPGDVWVQWLASRLVQARAPASEAT